MHRKIYYISRALFVIYIIGVCFACFWNFKGNMDIGIDWFGIPQDKIMHFVLFFPYPFISHLAFSKLRDTPLKLMRFIVITFLAGAAMGGIIEILQGLSGYRSCDLMDFFADCLGLGTALFLILVYEAFIRNWKKRIC